MGTHGPSHGTIDYTTGKVTISTVGVTANNGDLENDRNQVNRNINYTYRNPTLLAEVAITAERTGESDTAVRPNEAFLGHGADHAGSLSLNIGSAVLRENPALNGEIFSAPTVPATPPVVVATIDYDTGRIRFRSNVNPTGPPFRRTTSGPRAMPIRPL